MRRERNRANRSGRLQGRRISAVVRCALPDWLIGIVCTMVCLVSFSGCGAADKAYSIPIVTAQRDNLGQADGEYTDGEQAAGQGDGGQTAAGAFEENAAAESFPPSLCVVYVCGSVASPGLYELPSGSRAGDALKLAGGFLEDACLTAVNLAARVTDGQMLYFPSKEETEQGEYGADIFWGDLSGQQGGQASGAEGVPDGQTRDSVSFVNINTADKARLCTLPGIGEAKAEAIIAYRQQHGPFSAVEDLLAVSGIGDALLEKVRDRVTVN